MSEKTKAKAEEAAEEYAKEAIGPLGEKADYDFVAGVFLSGIDWFIEHELRGLLENAFSIGSEWCHDGPRSAEEAIAQLIEKARRG
jgi:hypothetical protein